ncbi:MAG: acyl-CoA dehydrogenase family protein [Myxococcota bacterium]
MTSEPILDRVRRFVDERIIPSEPAIDRWIRERDDPWCAIPEVEAMKAEARSEGLWNLFLPDRTHGAGLSVRAYASVAEETGRSIFAPEVFNCNAPDTGNMEVLHLYGTEQQKKEWLVPLLAGEIRSAFCMTEPEVASSDATNMQATAEIRGDEIVLNGRKWWSTGVGHPHCRLLLFMGVSAPDAPKHQRHSIVLVPMSTPGVRVERMLSVFGLQDPPYGHGEVVFEDVRVPVSNLIHGPGRGFEVAQGRLGPGRIHHCMRLIGAAERSLQLLVQRATSREAFGRPLAALGGNMDVIAECRIAIDQARLLTLQAAECIDRDGARSAMKLISQIKVVAPRMAQKVIDHAIQIHGGAGLHHDLPLTAFFSQARSLRLADGPDEVHLRVVAKMEIEAQLGARLG